MTTSIKKTKQNLNTDTDYVTLLKYTCISIALSYSTGSAENTEKHHLLQ